jgi:Holliday junction resolvase
MTGGRSPRRKGDGIERELINKHRALGVHAERYPLTGASRFRDSGHDIDIYAHGRDEAPLVAEVKVRKNGAGFTQLEKWLPTARSSRRTRTFALARLGASNPTK